MKISVVVTVLDEAEQIELLLSSLMGQNRQPDELVLVDGGSSDGTVELIQNWFKKSPVKFPVKILEKKSNISQGRNYGVEQAEGKWIAFTDAGCILDQRWLEELEAKAGQDGSKVVAGFYAADPMTAFEEAVVPYALVMPDRVDEANFLPASRSMLIEKKLFQKMGGFREELKYGEDYALARQLRGAAVQMSFAPKAIVYWVPRPDLSSFLTMIFNFAYWDVIASSWRSKVWLIFARYILGIFLVIVFGGYLLLNFSIFYFLIGVLLTIVLSVFLYGMWSVFKNKKYVPRGWFYLPILQITSDLAVMAGTIWGLAQKR